MFVFCKTQDKIYKKHIWKIKKINILQIRVKSFKLLKKSQFLRNRTWQTLCINKRKLSKTLNKAENETKQSN